MAEVKTKYFVDVAEFLEVKVWKKGQEIVVSIRKKETAQSLTMPLEVFRLLMDAQDVILLASDFMRGLVGCSPNDVPDDVVVIEEVIDA